MIEIHIAVLLFGLAGLFGKFLSFSPFLIVLGRTFFASLTLGIILIFVKRSFKIESFKDLVLFFLMGAVLSVHWTTFFKSIQVSTVAIGLLTFSTFPLFVTFMEPYFFHEKLRKFDILTASLVFLGLVLIIPNFSLSHNLTQGALWGILSGLTFAILSLLNRKYVKRYGASTVAFYQNAFATLFLLPFLSLSSETLGTNHLILLAILGIFCTALAHGLFIKGLTHVRAQLASITACLEPVYGIGFALVFLGEVPAIRTIFGGAIILGGLILATVSSRRAN
jgi:drug/metabolite transporter (DMT)-like permease